MATHRLRHSRCEERRYKPFQFTVRTLLSLALVIFQILLVTILAFLVNRFGLIRLARPGKKQQQLGGLYRRLGLLIHIVLLVLFVGDIYFSEFVFKFLDAFL